MVAPTMAPIIVNTSRNMASLMLAIFSLTKDEALPLEVAMMATMPAATASFTGTPQRTSIGVNMLAPPKPTREPTKPTPIEIRSRVSMSIKCLASSLKDGRGIKEARWLGEFFLLFCGYCIWRMVVSMVGGLFFVLCVCGWFT